MAEARCHKNPNPWVELREATPGGEGRIDEEEKVQQIELSFALNLGGGADQSSPDSAGNGRDDFGRKGVFWPFHKPNLNKIRTQK